MTPRIPTGLAACHRCDGGQTEPGTIGDLCRECGGHGLLPIDEAAECVPPWEAGEPPEDCDMPLDVLERDAAEWDGRRRKVLARVSAWREVRR